MADHSFEREHLFKGQTFYGQAELTDEQKMLKADLEKLEKDLIARKRQNYTKEENSEYLEDRMFQVQQNFYLRNQAVAESLKEELEKKKEKYLQERKKNVAEDMVGLMRLQLRYSSMTDEEVRQEAENYISNPGPEYSLDRLQTLNSELRKRGVEKIGHSKTVDAGGKESGPVREQSFAAWIQELGGDRPWLIQNPELVKALQLYSNQFGTFAALTEDGHIEPDLEIQKAFVPPG